MYKIKISYSTGNSFNSYNAEDYLDLTWNDLNIAKKNLINIKEHYDMYQLIEGYSTRSNKKNYLIENCNKDWFVKRDKLFCISQNRAIDEAQKSRYDNDCEYRIDEDFATNCLKLITDDGNFMQMSVFWCGYFEQLHEAEIVISDDYMKITF